MSGSLLLRVRRGAPGEAGCEVDYEVPRVDGMVVLDAIHHVQAHLDTDLACRWNCKAGRCGSCGAEVNGRPALLCTTRVDSLPGGPITVGPMRTYPLVRDLVVDVSGELAAARRVRPFSLAGADAGPSPVTARDVERLREFRSCIECNLCQDICHVLREHQLGERFAGPRQLVRIAALEMHPLDSADRTADIAEAAGLGYCNVTRCCTDICPEGIRITDNAIIPLKERAADRRWDPLRALLRRGTGAPP